MIKACFLVKYPPIQGGVSMTSYWLARELAERGHQIFVVTNANEVEDEYRIYLDDDDREWYEPRSATGGSVRVCRTQPSSAAMSYIPQANPFATKLSARATEVVRQHDCDVIFGYYLEPFGLAAHLASHWTGVPYMVRHAGSDLGRLMKQPGLTTAYREVILAADCVWTSRSMCNTFLGLGVSEESLWFGYPPRLPAVFNPGSPALDINALVRRLSGVQASHVRRVIDNVDPVDMSKPTIGIYGKVGEVKGSFDLLNALALLKRKGLDFNLLALTQGRTLPAFQQAIRDLDLHDRTWTLPFLPHWKVPGFIRACTAVCFLEREFPIAFHTPTVAAEVLACGTCLVLSGEIAAKQILLKGRLDDGRNLLLVPNPRDHAGLARQLQNVIEDPGRARQIGLAGYDMQKAAQSAADGDSARTLASALEEQFARMAETPRRPARPRAPADAATRKRQLKTRLPWASALLGDAWDRLIERYCLLHPSVAGNQFDDAVCLCEFLRTQPSGLNGGSAQFEDVLRYERSHNGLYADQDAMRQTETVDAASPGATVPAGSRPRRRGGRRLLLELQDKGIEEVLRVRLVKAPGVSVEEFDSDFGQLASALRRGARPHGVPPVKTTLVFKRDLNRVGVELKINAATRALLELCDGHHTVRSAIGEMGRFYQQTGAPLMPEEQLTREVIEAIRELTGREVIWLLAEG